jgi:hypothetical protein
MIHPHFLLLLNTVFGIYTNIDNELGLTVVKADETCLYIGIFYAKVYDPTKTSIFYPCQDHWV